jgi:NADPH-dependent 2,4-dienoyl-CoA reductase/sulfur reductase-like enzyme
LVDERFSTNADNVFAAGDCAEIVTPEGQRNTLEQLWYTGKMQGAVAGRIMAGEEARYDRGIWYNSAKFVDLEWHTYGRVPGAHVADETPSLYWEHDDHRRCLRIAHRDGKVTGMNAMGLRHRHRVWERWIAEERDVEYVLDHLREANFDPELFRRFEPSIVAATREQLR